MEAVPLFQVGVGLARSQVPLEMLGSNWVRGAGSKGRNKY